MDRSKMTLQGLIQHPVVAGLCLFLRDFLYLEPEDLRPKELAETDPGACEALVELYREAAYDFLREEVAFRLLSPDRSRPLMDLSRPYFEALLVAGERLGVARDQAVRIECFKESVSNALALRFWYMLRAFAWAEYEAYRQMNLDQYEAFWQQIEAVNQYQEQCYQLGGLPNASGIQMALHACARQRFRRAEYQHLLEKTLVLAQDQQKQHEILQEIAEFLNRAGGFGAASPGEVTRLVKQLPLNCEVTDKQREGILRQVTVIFGSEAVN